MAEFNPIHYEAMQRMSVKDYLSHVKMIAEKRRPMRAVDDED